MEGWKKCSDELPPDGELVLTQVDDADGIRNNQYLRRKRNLWFVPDNSTYVYYTPTHWRTKE